MIKIDLPLKLSESEKKILLTYLWKIQVNRNFILYFYSDVENKGNYLGRLRNGISSLCLPLTLKGAKAENAWPSFRTEAKPGIFSRIAK